MSRKVRNLFLACTILIAFTTILQPINANTLEDPAELIKEMQKEVLRALQRASNESLNAQDVDRFISYWADEVLWDYVSMPPPMNSKEEIAAFLSSIFQVFPDLRVDQDRVLVSGNTVVAESIVTGTHLARWMGIPTTRKSFQTTRMDILEFESNKIKRMATYDDMLSLRVEIGAARALDLPPLSPSFAIPDPEPTGMLPVEAAVEAQSRWNAYDLPGNAKMQHPDDDILFAPFGISLDREAYAALQELYFAAFPDLRAESLNLVDMEDGWVLCECLWKGTNSESFLGFPATGSPIELKVAILYRFDEEGLETNMSVYYDNMTLLAQLGVVPPVEPTVYIESNKNTARRYFDEVWNQGKLDVLDEIYAADSISYFEGLEDVVGIEGQKLFVAMQRNAFLDLEWTVDDMIAEPEKIVVRWTFAGTQRGEFMGVPPTGEYITVTGISIFHIDEDGKIAQGWTNLDTLGIMEQLWVIPPAEREGFAWSEPTEQPASDVSPEQMKANSRDFFDQVWNQGNLSLIDETHTADYVLHDPTTPGVRSPEGLRQFVASYRDAFDMQWTIEDVIAEEGKIAIRWKAAGVQTGEFMGVPSTGEQMTITGITIGRYTDGKVGEEWKSWDKLGLLQQLGAIPQIGAAEDFTHVFPMSLMPGLNLISLPLKPVVPYTARLFARELSATTVIRYNATLQKHEGFTPDAPGNGFVIEGGRGYIVNTPQGGKVTFKGTAWGSKPSATMAPPAVGGDSAWAFVVSGLVLDGEANHVRSDNQTVIVKNLRTRAVAVEMVGSGGYFAAAYADLSRKAVVKAGDRIEVIVIDSAGNVMSGPSVHQVTLDAIRNAVLSVQMRLGDIIPAKSALLQNYPNPFNPDTWIPYQIAEDVNIAIRIYSISGHLIRKLDLGHKPAGSYTTRSRAAYWDGKNEAGEQVASGIYFYTIHAGDFIATKKMTVAK